MLINKRDGKFFFLGILTIFLIDGAYDWKDIGKTYQEGYNSAK